MALAMPIKDGISAARELKADPDTKEIPLIAFTALAMRGDEGRARDGGFDGYRTRPLEKGALDAALAKFLPLQAGAGCPGRTPSSPSSSASRRRRWCCTPGR